MCKNVESPWQMIVLVMAILWGIVRVLRWTSIMTRHKRDPKSKTAYNKCWLIIDRVYLGLTVAIVII